MTCSAQRRRDRGGAGGGARAGEAARTRWRAGVPAGRAPGRETLPLRGPWPVGRGGEITMKQAIEDWVNWMHGRRLSLTTVSGYGWELERLAVKHPGLGAFDFRARHLNQYLAERRLLDGVGVASSRHTVCALKSFFGYVCGGAKSPARGLPYPRVPKKVQRSLSFEQLCAVLAACDTSTAKGKRDVALMCVLADTGLRASEVCRLRLADLDLAGGWLKVVVKGGDEEVGIFTSYTAAQIGAWLTVRERYAKAEAVALFVSLRSGQAPTRNRVKEGGRKKRARAGGRPRG